MRDRNQLSYQQFNIQLEKNILQSFQRFGTRRNSFSQELSLEFRPGELHSEFLVVFPRNYRLLRSLCISFWYFPENLHFLTRLRLEDQSFSFLNEKQRIEISILLSSKENMLKYLYLTERYSGNEIFGNILGNDLHELSKKFVVTRKFYPKPRKKIFRRGPKDKGSRRVISLGPHFEEDLRSDVWIQQENQIIEKKKIYLHKVTTRIIIFLEKFETS